MSGSWDKTVALWDARAPHSLVHTFSGHNDAVIRCSYSPVGDTIISSDYSGCVNLWDVKTLSLASLMKGHNKAVYACCWSPSGRHAATGCLAGQVIVWDRLTGQKVREKRIEAGVRALTYTPSGFGILVGSYPASPLETWDLGLEIKE